MTLHSYHTTGRTLMESENDESHSEKSGTSSDTDQQWMEAILRSPTKKARLLQRIGLDDDRITNKDAEDTPARAGGGKGAGVATGQSEQRRHATGGQIFSTNRHQSQQRIPCC